MALDCKTVGFFLKISKEIDKAWRKSLTRAKRASLTRPFDCSRVLEYAKIRTVLQSIMALVPGSSLSRSHISSNRGFQAKTIYGRGLRSGILVFCCLKRVQPFKSICAALCFEHISEHFVTFLGETEHLIQCIKCGIKVKHFSGGKLETTKKQKQRKRPHATSYPEGFSLRKWRPPILSGKRPEDQVGTPCTRSPVYKNPDERHYFTVLDLKKKLSCPHKIFARRE